MWLSALSVVVLSALAPGAAVETADLAGLERVTADEPAPHVAWGVPLEGGPIRAVIVAPLFTLRDAVELANRLELDFDTIPFWNAGAVSDGGALGSDSVPAETRLARLREALDDSPDLLILGNFDLGLLPEDLWQAVAARVEAGTGLILANHRHSPLPAHVEAFIEALEPEDAPSIRRGIGESLTPEWNTGLDFVHTGRHGEGRVVELNYSGGRPQSHFLLPAPTQPLLAEREHLDAYVSLAAKAARWAAKREPRVCIERFESAGPPTPTAEQIPSFLPEEYAEQLQESAVRQPYMPYRLVLNEPADRTYTVRVQVRQPGRNWTQVYDTYEQQYPLEKGQTHYSVNLGLGSGSYFVDLWLLDKGRVVDWHTAVIEVVGWPHFSDLKLTKQSVLPNDTLGISLNIAPPLHPQLYADRLCTVVARATDPLQRIVATALRNVPEQSGHVELSLDMSDLIAPRVKIEVFVVDMPRAVTTEGREPSEIELGWAAYAHRYLPVRQPLGPDRFALVVRGDTGGEYNARTWCRALAARGADFLCSVEGMVGAFCGAEANLAPLPILTQLAPVATPDGLQRVPCLSDPDYLREEAKRIEMAVEEPWVRDAFLHSLGSGNCLATGEENLCQSPTCLAGFRNRLRAAYGTIGALNAAWKSGHVDWEQVMPGTLADARQSGVYAPWVDFRQYMDSVFLSAHTLDRDMLLSLYASDTGLPLPTPAAAGIRIGFSAGPGNGPYTGYDWSRMAGELSLLAVPPDRLAVEKLRSYRMQGCFTGIVCGQGYSSLEPRYLSWYPWYALLHGMQAVWFEGALGGAATPVANAAVAPDGRVLPAFRRIADEAVEIRGGLDALLLNATPAKASVAVYDSPASYYLSLADRTYVRGEADASVPLVRADRGDAHAAQASLIAALADLGYAYDFVSPAQALEGRLKEYRIVFLPMARALDDDEIQALRDFQAAGGWLVADVAPGRYDEHGAPRPTPALAETFGVAWEQPAEAGAAARASVGFEWQDGKVEAKLGEVVPDASVAPADAVLQGEAGESPVWFRHAVGEAEAWLMNHPMPDYLRLAPEDADAFRDLLGGLLRAAGVRPVFALRGQDYFPGERMLFRFGKAEILGLLRDPSRGGEMEKVEPVFEGDARVFDMRQGVALRPRKAALKLERERPALLSRLPYEVVGLALAVPEETGAGKRLPIGVAVHTRGGLPDKHVVRIEIAPAGGAPLAHYGRTVVCEAGEGSTYIPLGRRETPGIYHVMAWDVLSGTFAEAIVSILSEDAPGFAGKPPGTPLPRTRAPGGRGK